MRREPYQIEDGKPALWLVSVSENDRLPTVVELKAANVALCSICKDHSPAFDQLAAVRVRGRHRDGYGAYVEFELLGPQIMPDPLLRMGEFPTSSIKAPWRTHPLHCALVLSEEGFVGELEFYPIDGENWSVEEMERLLFGSEKDVVISAMPWSREGRTAG